MAVDTPAKIAIIGAGSTGLEAALYARYLGYDVEIFEVGDHVAPRPMHLADRKMFTPFAQNISSLGIAALRAHDENFQLADSSEAVSFAQWRDKYLLPLAQTDLLCDAIHVNTRVIAVGKVEINKVDCPSGEFDRGAWDFRLLVRAPDNQQRIVLADIVFDCSGRQPNHLGHGGIAAVNEYHHSTGRLYGNDGIFYSQLAKWGGKSILLVGDDWDAACSANALQKLVEQDPTTRVTWMTGREVDRDVGPFACTDDPLLPRRQELERANEFAQSAQVRWLSETWVDSLSMGDTDKTVVTFGGAAEGEESFDCIVVQTGHGPTHNVSNELQVDLCPATDAPRAFAAALKQRPSPFSLEYPAKKPAAMLSGEPNYYILGSKSFGRLPGYLTAFGHRQIRDVFTIIGDRPDLDLYKRYADED